MSQFLNEFKEFAMKGNVIDLAVWVVIGTSFGKIVSALVDSVIMPLIGIIMQWKNFADLSFGIGDAQVKYGQLIQSVLDFAIIAFALFVVVKAINTAKEKIAKKEARQEAKQEITKLTTEQELLTEIRDILKKHK